MYNIIHQIHTFIHISAQKKIYRTTSSLAVFIEVIHE